MNSLDYYTLGLKIGDEIRFIPTGQFFAVCAGEGLPMVTTLGPFNGIGCSLRLMTRILQGDEFDGSVDTLELWEFRGETLRHIHQKSLLTLSLIKLGTTLV